MSLHIVGLIILAVFAVSCESTQTSLALTEKSSVNQLDEKIDYREITRVSYNTPNARLSRNEIQKMRNDFEDKNDAPVIFSGYDKFPTNLASDGTISRSDLKALEYENQ